MLLGKLHSSRQVMRYLREPSCTSPVEAGEVQIAALRSQVQRLGEELGQLCVRLEESHTEIRRLNDDLQRLQEDALTDAMSGLLNRRAFERRLQRFAEQAAGGAGCLSLILLDIDCFKQINDLYGHPLGDRVIAAVGRTIRHCVGTQGVSARYGGDEFAVLLPLWAAEPAMVMAQSIRLRVQDERIRRRQGEEPIGSVTVSAGVATWRQDADAASLIEQADGALYAAKRAGRNRVTIEGDWR
jgi:diguanylate cyclase